MSCPATGAPSPARAPLCFVLGYYSFNIPHHVLSATSMSTFSVLSTWFNTFIQLPCTCAVSNTLDSPIQLSPTNQPVFRLQVLVCRIPCAVKACPRFLLLRNLSTSYLHSQCTIGTPVLTAVLLYCPFHYCFSQLQLSIKISLSSPFLISRIFIKNPKHEFLTLSYIFHGNPSVSI